MIAYRGIASREGKQRRATTPWSRWAGMKRRSPKGFLVSRSRIERNFRVPITLIGIGEKAEQPAGCLAVRLVGWLVGWLLAPLGLRFRKNYAIYILLLFKRSLKILVKELI